MNSDFAAREIKMKHLERFLAVVEHGGLAEAARVLGISQQALGMSLARLEEIVGVTLIQRAQGLPSSPTQYGSLFLRYARSQLNAMSQAIDELHALRSGQTGSLAIGVGETFDPQIIALVLRDLHREHPGVEIRVVEGYSELLLEQILDGRLDILCGSIPQSGLLDDLVSTDLFSMNDVVICRPQHPLCGRSDLELEELAGFTWLVPGNRPGDRASIINSFLSAGLEPPRRFIRTDAFTVGTLLMHSDDFLFMTTPALLGHRDLPFHTGLVQLPISQPTITRFAGILHSRIRPLTGIGQLALERIERFSGVNPCSAVK